MRTAGRMRRVVPTVLAMLLIAASLPTGAAVSAEGVASGWRQALVIDSALAGPTKMFEAFDTASLNLYDFNGDGQLEIVSNNDNNVAYVIDSRSGKVLSEITTFHYNNSKWPIRELNPISVGDLYGDGVPCMVIPNSAAHMSAWCYDATASTPTAFKFDKKWEIKVDAALHEPGFKESHPWLYDANGTLKKDFSLGLDGNAYLADVDGDGKKEIFIETDGYPGQMAFNADGTYRWSKSFWDGNGGAKVLDVDKDGVKEAVFVSDGGVVSSYNAKTGGIEWVFEAGKNGAWPGSIPVPALVADLHGDGRHETVFGVRNITRDHATNPNWINESHARYYALDHKGQILWTVSYDWMNPLQYNHPAAVDVNADGVLDVVVLDWNTVGHKPGDWDVTNRSSNLFALDGREGNVLWRRSVEVWWSNKDFVVADVDGDGKHDIIAPTARMGSDGLGVYDLKTGQRKGWFPLDWQASRGPVAGDLYGDGKLYIVVPVAKKMDQPNYRSLDVGYRQGQLRIIETGAAWDVLFSANFLLSDDQKETQKGTSGKPPTPPTQQTNVTPTPTTATPPTSVPNATPTPTTSTPATTSPATTTPASTTPASTTPTSTTPASTTPATGTPATSTPPPTGATPTPTESASPVPGPGALALLAAAAAGALVLARRKR